MYRCNPNGSATYFYMHITLFFYMHIKLFLHAQSVKMKSVNMKSVKMISTQKNICALFYICALFLRNRKKNSAQILLAMVMCMSIRSGIVCHEGALV